ncbi:hypothetical protein [Dactylosporangium sp. CA-092794]|uniref:hypothetical protein n=1 Tax=Dactylosporangium sp. CA-092794 TaxID=3239929 RepID=UPI003D8B616F
MVMKGHATKWILAGVGITLAAGVVGLVAAATRCNRPAIEQGIGAEPAERIGAEPAELEAQPAGKTG